MYSEVYRPEPEGKNLTFIPKTVRENTDGVCAVVAAVLASNSDHIETGGVTGIISYCTEWLGYFVAIGLIIHLFLTFGEHFSKTKFFSERTEIKWVVITLAVGVALYFVPLNFTRMSKRCPVCGQETSVAYIVYKGQRYCLKDGSQLLYDDGEYDFYN